MHPPADRPDVARITELRAALEAYFEALGALIGKPEDMSMAAFVANAPIVCPIFGELYWLRLEPIK